MARITVEDCLEHVENRFALVHVAANRVKELVKNPKAYTGPNKGLNNRVVVRALREIAAGTIIAAPRLKDEEKE